MLVNFNYESSYLDWYLLELIFYVFRVHNMVTVINCIFLSTKIHLSSIGVGTSMVLVG